MRNLALIASIIVQICTVRTEYYDDRFAAGIDDPDDVENNQEIFPDEREKYVTVGDDAKSAADDSETSATGWTDIVFSNKDVRLISSNCSALVLNGTDLYSMDVGTSANGVIGLEIKPFGMLGNLQSDESIVDVAYKKGLMYTFMLVALQTHYQVFVVFNDRDNGQMQAIEKIAMNGVHQQMRIFSQQDSWYCLIGNGFSNELGTSSTMRLFKWRQSHFTLLDQYTVTPMHDVRLCETADAKILIMVVGESPGDEETAAALGAGSAAGQLMPLKLIEVYVFDADRLRHVQNVHTNGAALYTPYLHARCMLIAMPDQRSGGLTKPEFLQWDSNFHMMADHQAVLFDDMVTNNYDLAFTQFQDTINAYTVGNFRRGQRIGIKMDPNTQIVMLDWQDQLYLALLHRSENETAVTYSTRTLAINVEMVNATNDDVGANDQSVLSEQCFRDLDQAITSRQTVIEELRANVKDRMHKDQNSVLTALIADNAYVNAAAFDAIQINLTNAISVSQLRQQIDALKSRIGKLYELHSSRLKRNASAPAPDNSSVLDTLVVKRLWIRNNTFAKAMIRNHHTVMHLHAPITVKTLHAEELNIVRNESEIGSDILRQKRQTDRDPTRIQRLSVKTINGIEWDRYVASLYLRNNRNAIKGNLILNKPCLVQQANFEAINNIRVSSFFTLHTAQNVNSQVFLTRFHAPDVYANLTNGLSFETDVVMLSGDQTIDSPVMLQKCTIDQLELSDSDPSDVFARHIVGTRLEDLSQIYSGKVTINGSLRLANVRLENSTPRRRPRVFVNGLQFEVSSLEKQYWMRSTDQEVSVAAQFQQPLLASQLFVDRLNGLAISAYLQTTHNPLAAVNLVLHSAAIRGNLYTDPNYRTTLTTLNDQCVRRLDTDAVRINGRLEFGGLVTVDHLHSADVDYRAEMAPLFRNDLLASNVPMRCVKHFHQLIVMGNVQVTGEHLNVVTMNGIDVAGGIPNMARITEPTTLDELTIVGGVIANNVSVSVLGDTDFVEIIAKRILNGGSRMKELHTSGASEFDDVYVRSINGIDVEEYLSRLVTIRGAQHIRIGGRKTFLAGLTVQNMNAHKLDDHIDAIDWFANVLHTQRPQEITGRWRIATIDAVECVAPAINAVPMSELLDGGQNVVDIYSDVTIASGGDGLTLVVEQNVHAQENVCAYGDLKNSLSSGVITNNWPHVEVQGWASWPTNDLTTPLNRLLAYGVTVDTEQTIAGHVTLDRRSTQLLDVFNATEMSTTFSPIADCDILAIIADALLNTSDFQTIRGTKQFMNGLSTRSLHIANDLRARLWNGCDMSQLNSTLFRANADTSIAGPKRFQTTPMFYYLNVDGGQINGIPIDDVVCANSSAVLAAPVVMLAELHVTEQLHIVETLNYLPIGMLLENRVRRYGDAPQDVRGVLSFENVILRGASRLSTLNGIPMSEIVVRSTDAEQTIAGRKRIRGQLQLNGPAVVTNLNGVDLVQSYSRSIRLDANVQLSRLQIDNNITLTADGDANGSADGMQLMGELNGADLMELMYWQPPLADDLQPIHKAIRNSMQRAENTFETTLSTGPAAKSYGFYLDDTSDIRIKFVQKREPATTNAGSAAAEQQQDATALSAVYIDTSTLCSGNEAHQPIERAQNSDCWCPVQNELLAANTFQVLVNRRPLYERRIRLIGRNGNYTILTRFARVGCDTTSEPAANTLTAVWQIVGGGWQTQNLLSSHEQPTTSQSNVSSVRDVKLFEQDDSSFILVEYVAGSVQVWRRHETPNTGDIVWIDNGLIQHEGRPIDRICVLSWQNYNLLLALSTQPSGVDVHSVSQMFYFDGSSFLPLANGAIAGDYDQCASVYMNDQQQHSDGFMLWLGKKGSDVVTVFKTVYQAGYLRKFEMLQTIVVADGRVRSLQSLSLGDSSFVAIMTMNDFLVMYKYKHLAGWTRTTCGYFHDIESVLPLHHNRRPYIYVSMRSSAQILEVHNIHD